MGGKIIFCGNGGNFADAQHLSAEFTSKFLCDRPGLASIAFGHKQFCYDGYRE